MQYMTSITSSRQSGFSLMELAVVLMIIGTLMSGVLVAVSRTTENTRRTAAKAQLREVEEALYGYAQTYGRLPCPADADTSGRADPETSNACNLWHGFVPSTTLGMSGSVNEDGLLLDPWQNPLRYSLASLNNAFSTTTLLQTMFINNTLPTTDPNLLCIADTDNCSGTILSEIAPAVVISMGADWAAYTSAAELENASGTTLTNAGTGNSYTVSNDNHFVSTTYAEDVFDDQLVWLSPHVLFNRMISAGQLP